MESEKSKPSPTTDSKKLWDEYKILGQTVGRRENSLLVSGSIFVTASLVLLGQSTTISDKPTLMQFAVLTSRTVYSTWLFLLQLTAGRITDRTYDRMRFMEGKLGIEVHEYLKTKRDPVRRWIWLWLLDGLLIAGTLMMGFDVWPLRISLPTQVIFMASLPFWKARMDDKQKGDD